MNKNRRDLLKDLSLAGLSGVVTNERLVTGIGQGLTRTSHAQSGLPESFVGVDVKAKYLNLSIPSPIDVLVSEAHADHIPIPDPWNIVATKNDENTYKIEIMNGGRKAVRTGIFNIDGSKGKLTKDKQRSCKNSLGKMSKTYISQVSAEGLTFRANFKVLAELKWDLVPGGDLFPAIYCG